MTCITRRAPGTCASAFTITTASDQTLVNAGRPALLVVFIITILTLSISKLRLLLLLLLLGAGRPAFLLVVLVLLLQRLLIVS